MELLHCSKGYKIGRDLNDPIAVVIAVRLLSEEAMKPVHRRAGSINFQTNEWLRHSDVIFKGFEDEPAVTLWSFFQANKSAQPKWPLPRAILPASARTFSPIDTESEPQDIETEDFISGYEVWLEKPRSGGERPISGQIHFHPRMYLDTGSARVFFGIRRFFIESSKTGPGELSVPDDVRRGISHPRAIQVNPDGKAISLCITAERGKTFGASALPRIGDDNFLAELATADALVRANRVRVELRVPLKPEGIHLAAAIEPLVSQQNRDDIAAIAAILVRKGHGASVTGHIRRSLKVRQRGNED